MRMRSSERKMTSKKPLSKTQAKKPTASKPDATSSTSEPSDYVVPQPPVKPSKDRAEEKEAAREPRGIKAYLLSFIDRKIKQYSKF